MKLFVTKPNGQREFLGEVTVKVSDDDSMEILTLKPDPNSSLARQLGEGYPPPIEECRPVRKMFDGIVALWCEEHDLRARHFHPSHLMVCQEYAAIRGCDCCPENYKAKRN